MPLDRAGAGAPADCVGTIPLASERTRNPLRSPTLPCGTRVRQPLSCGVPTWGRIDSGRSAPDISSPACRSRLHSIEHRTGRRSGGSPWCARSDRGRAA
jgi:hypothetical protein